MFVGHYSATIAVKALEPRAPLWTLAAAAQLIDIGWSAFIITGVEHASADPALPGSPLILTDMPWTHSLPAVIVWSAGATALSRWLLRLPMAAAVLIGATVFSHWLLDLLVHRPDLALWPGGPKVGLALWDYAVPEQAVEIGLIALAAVFWGAVRARRGQSAWPAAVFVLFLLALQIIAMFLPAEAGPLPPMQGVTALVVYLAVVAAALPLDGRRVSASQG